MGIAHPAYYCKYIIFGLAIVLSFLAFSSESEAYSSIFVVEDVKVDVTAENSVVAQEQAFAQAQQEAFQILTQRMVDEAQAAQVKTPDLLTISSLIKDYEVLNEKISAVRYIGTYKFRFHERAVSSFFSVSGVSFTDTRSRPLLVLPIFQRNGKNSIWAEDNIWLKAWGRTNIGLSDGLVPVEVPIGDLMDISDIDENQALSYERHKLDRMLARYNAKEAAIMIAVPDETLAQISDIDQTAMGQLRISIYRTDRIQAEHVQDLVIEATEQESVSALYQRGVQQSYKALQKDWKNKTVSNSGQNATYRVRVLYNTLKQWVQIQNSLRGLYSVTDLTIGSVTKNEAQISFKFRGDAGQLSDSLRRANLSLEERASQTGKPEAKSFILRYGVQTQPVRAEVEKREENSNVHTF